MCAIMTCSQATNTLPPPEVVHEPSNLEEILAHLGGVTGTYQIRNLLCVCVAVVLSAMFQLSYVFTSRVPGYRCLLEECESSQAEYMAPYIEHAVPFKEDGDPKHCERFTLIYNATNCSDSQFDQHQVEGCSKFVFDPTERTIVQDFNLTCDDNLWLVTLVGTVNSLGPFVGIPLSGIISDRFGRLSSLTFCLLGSCVAGISRSFAPNYYTFLALEFLDPALGSGAYATAFVLALEQAGPGSGRVLTSTIASACYALGEAVIGAIVWLTSGSWRSILLWLYAPGVPLSIALWFVGPESVRWQVARGRFESARSALRRAAHLNAVSLSEHSLASLGAASCEQLSPGKVEEPSGGMMEVLRSTRLLLRLLNCSFVWAVCNFVFYGLSQSAANVIPGNYILNFVMVALAEIPGYVVTYPLLQKLGRRGSLCGSLIAAGIACFIFAFLPSSTPKTVGLMVFLLGKCSITISFTTLYVFSSEMFPTEIRHTLIAVCCSLARVGLLLAPQAPLISRYVNPFYLFGAMACAAGFAALVFPETRGTTLPNTVLEAKALGQNSQKPKTSTPSTD